MGFGYGVHNQSRIKPQQNKTTANIHRAVPQKKFALAQVSKSMNNTANTLKSRPAFDPKQFQSMNRVLYQPFLVSRTQPLWQALDRDLLDENTDILLFELPESGGIMSLIKSQMAFHHTAQGQMHNEPWLLSYCETCLTAASFSPVVQQQPVSITFAGHYHASPLLTDEMTQSLWDHITGVCLTGEAKGETLQRLGPVFHLQVKQAMRTFPQTQIGISQPNLRSRLAPLFKKPVTSPLVSSSVDTRRPEMDEGLGVWDNLSARYYSLEKLRQNKNVLQDKFNGRDTIIWVDPSTQTPYALYTTSRQAAWAGDRLWLDGDRYIRDGQLFNSLNQLENSTRPWQTLSRWAGFSAAFPGCEIYAAEEVTAV